MNEGEGLTPKCVSGYLDSMPSPIRASKSHTVAQRSSSHARGRAIERTRDIDAVVHSASDALGALSVVERDMRALEVRKLRLIGAAQRHGASWDEIGSALEVSRQAAWEKYRDRVRVLFDVAADRAQRSEEETLESAATVLREVRRRRRRG